MLLRDLVQKMFRNMLLENKRKLEIYLKILQLRQKFKFILYFSLVGFHNNDRKIEKVSGNYTN